MFTVPIWCMYTDHQGLAKLIILHASPLLLKCVQIFFQVLRGYLNMQGFIITRYMWKFTPCYKNEEQALKYPNSRNSMYVEQNN